MHTRPSRVAAAAFSVFAFWATSATAEVALSLSLSGPAQVTDVSNLVVNATVWNSGDEPISLLKDPRGVLNPFPTDTFIITHESEASPEFIGPRIKYVPENQVGKDRFHLFAKLTPGESVSVSHNLAANYNWTQTGTGQYIIEATNLFHFVDPHTNMPIPIYAEFVDGYALTLSGQLQVPLNQTAKRQSTPSTTKPKQAFIGCTDAQVHAVRLAITGAEQYSSAAWRYAQGHTLSTKRYASWFGTYTPRRHTTVVQHFTSLSRTPYNSYTYDCSSCTEEAHAFVFPIQHAKVFLCKDFWSAPVLGTNSKAGTLIHEASHFTVNVGAQDHSYGHAAALRLARMNPNQAIFNADSHEYFAENNPNLP